MNVDIAKQECLTLLYRVEREATILLNRIVSFREDVLKAKTIEELNDLADVYDLEADYEHITLFYEA